MKKNAILTNLLTFVVLFLLLNFAKNYFFPSSDTTDLSKKGTITLLSKNEFSLGDLVSAEIENNSTQIFTIKNNCPKEPLEVLIYTNGEWTQKTKSAMIPCEGTSDIQVKPGEKRMIDFISWNHALFGETGKYKLRAHGVLSPAPEINNNTQTSTTSITQTVTSSSETQTTQNTTQQINNPTATTGSSPVSQPSADALTKTIESLEFEMKPQGTLSYLWATIFYQPLYNILIFLISIAPGKDLGLAILLLTIIIRTILLVPSQNALKSQRKMQELQPKLAKIKEKYKDNQEMLAKETMAVWKDNKANPLGSCLPLLIQFPVLIALFYVVKDGLNPDNGYLLYDFLKNFSFEHINVHFLNILDLTKINFFILPLIVGGLQFLQMKLASVKAKKGNAAHESASDKPAKKTPKNEMEIATSTMMYIMPVMIAVFTSQAPAGVGLYWGVSTLYGIAQQLVVNRQSSKDQTKIKVLPNPKT